MSIMKDEVLSQKYVLRHCLESNIERINSLSTYINDNNIKVIEIASRGSSNNACVLFKYLVETYTSLRVNFIPLSTVTLFSGNITNNNSIVIAVSQGGKGKDLQIVLDNAKKNNVYTVAITNDNDSPLAKLAHSHICMNIPNEEAMAATKSFTSEMLLLALLAYNLSSKDYTCLLNIENIAKEIFDLDSKIKEFANRFVGIKNMFVLSRGFTLAVAKEVCCKLQETCFINATPYATSDFLHGPFALIDNTSNILMIVPSDNTLTCNKEMLERLSNQNANIIVITDNIDIAKEYNGLLISDYNELRPFAFTFALQLACCYLTEALGTNPDTSRNLNKYTITI